jgi:hypothetical protein
MDESRTEPRLLVIKYTPGGGLKGQLHHPLESLVRHLPSLFL